VGAPPTQPSLGTLIRIGNDFLFSGEWWITVFPGAALVILVLAIIEEATLSFLGVGLPVTQPSLGTLIRIGQEYIASGEWWILLFPSLALVAIALSVNIVGDWLRDALNPKLR
jgi:ABC-type dipeptide/oligopeptide/nickel transport system permease subunit